MATVTTTSSSSVSTLAGYCFVAEGVAGSNGSTGSGAVPEVDVTDYAGTAASTRKVWDSNPSDGIDSAWVGVQLIVAAGGGANGVKWTVSGATAGPVYFSSLSYGTIAQVRIRAAVNAEAGVAWKGLNVTFSKAGTNTDSYAAVSGPTVNTVGSSPVTGEVILSVVPNRTDNDKVVVSGQLRLTSPSSTPGWNDMMAQIFIDTSTCAEV